jgi:hypothetical protein
MLFWKSVLIVAAAPTCIGVLHLGFNSQSITIKKVLASIVGSADCSSIGMSIAPWFLNGWFL